MLCTHSPRSKESSCSVWNLAKPAQVPDAVCVCRVQNQRIFSDPTCLMLNLQTITVLLACLAVSSSAHAGWITLTNETDHVVIIQETTGPLNNPIRGKSIKLQPGETYKEFQLLAGRRAVLVSVPKSATVVAAVVTLNWGTSDAPFQLVASGQTLKFETASTEKKNLPSKSSSSK